MALAATALNTACAAYDPKYPAIHEDAFGHQTYLGKYGLVYDMPNFYIQR